MADVVDVAEYVLSKLGPMTAMKLQKLVYYAHAWHLVWDGEPMLDARIEAWANGPVVPELHEMHRDRFKVHPGTFFLAREARDARITITVDPAGGFTWSVPDLMIGGVHTGHAATIAEAAEEGRTCLLQLREGGDVLLQELADKARADGVWAEPPTTLPALA